MTANEIRKKYLEFFKSKGHSVIASDSLVPKDDPTVLFTTAGMQQFKRQFLGHIDGFTRATTSQKCLRTDDLDVVGVTAFHHTMFEMLGNFSFGDYFKKEAIEWAWEFLTKVIGIPGEKLWVSIYKDDTEAEDIWLNHMKFPKHKLVKLGDKSNFWPSNARLNGPNGPCGPCSEIFFDYGFNPRCDKGDQCDPDCSCGRFSEVWNLVFTQFNRKDGGVLEPLPNKNIDTGMGLERLVAVVQGKKTNYDTDLFMPIRQAIHSEICQGKIKLGNRDELVIADHIRAVVFAISDGVIPSNKERGSVVKRLINDSTNLVLNAGGTEASIYKLVPSVIEIFKEQYPEIIVKKNDLMNLIQRTEDAFIQVRKERLPIVEAEFKKTTTAEERGNLLFINHDTYGLPCPTTATVMDKVLNLKQAEHDAALAVFKNLMKEQQDRARASSKMAGDVFLEGELKLDVAKTEFIGYTHLSTKAKILKLFISNKEVLEVSTGDAVQVVLDKTPFYAESGGQIGDSGLLLTGAAKIQIDDTQKTNNIFVHTGKVLEGMIKTHETVHAEVDEKRRLSIMRNHTATHILQSALRTVLGTHVQQQGSLVAEDRLRFDFTHPNAIAPAQKAQIEEFVNASIRNKDHVEKKEMPIEEAKKLGALSFFAEKYGAKVRVISIGNFSKEFCGGTHLNSTAEIERFRLTSEGAVAQGIRRIEAKTGDFATAYEKQLQREEEDRKLREQDKAAEKQRQQKIEQELFDTFIKNDLPKLMEASQNKVVVHKFKDVGIEFLRKVYDYVKAPERLGSGIAVLSSASAEGAQILVGVSQDLTAKVSANDVIKAIAPVINGSGGGKPTMAQAGSKENQNLDAALQKAKEIILGKL
ncbi:MAG: alanine--tRNA ligase [Candidatus Omnitrophica bacterium]|nr:alanine--tRNA ligase [Candidatus Omnitrophota bacterium]